ncbi:hypothetical protein ACET3Z_027266 [Daucus carota]
MLRLSHDFRLCNDFAIFPALSQVLFMDEKCMIYVLSSCLASGRLLELFSSGHKRYTFGISFIFILIDCFSYGSDNVISHGSSAIPRFFKKFTPRAF